MADALDLADVLADARGDAATLRRAGNAGQAEYVEALCERVPARAWGRGMTRHAHAGEAPPVRNLGTAGLDLFDRKPEPPAQSETFTQAQRNADIHAWLETLVPIARELARKAGRQGVTISDVRISAVNRGLMTDEEFRTRGSALGHLMKMAGLVATEGVRRSTVPQSNRNRHTIWLAPEFAMAA